MIPETAEQQKLAYIHRNINTKRLNNLITNILSTLNRNRVLTNTGICYPGSPESKSFWLIDISGILYYIIVVISPIIQLIEISFNPSITLIVYQANTQLCAVSL
jgi:hypothetical protein